MQEQPHPVGLIQAQLDEVVATAEGTELLAPLGRVRQVDPAVLRQVLEVRDAASRERETRERVVVISGRQRNRRLDRGTQRSQVTTMKIGGGEFGAGGDHPAPDVDADCRRDHGVDGGDDRADSRPLPLWASGISAT